jgi:hypothetical protein
MRRTAFLLAVLGVQPPAAHGQAMGPVNADLVQGAKAAYETLMTKPVRLTFEPIAPTAGLTAGVGVKPKDWRTPSQIRSVRARASYSVNRYWAADGSVAWQSVNNWRVEPYARFRSMKRLNHFGLGNASRLEDRADFAMLDRRVGAYGYKRPVGWLGIGGRGEFLAPRTAPGESPSLPSVQERFAPAALAGFRDDTNFIYAGAFVNLNYPYIRSERPPRGGDYMATIAVFHDASGTEHSFTRVELEGTERFPISGSDRRLTVHARLSSSVAAESGHTVPFYLLDTLGGADNLRGFKEQIIGGDETTATLRNFESFRFRDLTTAFAQIEFRQRAYSQIFVSVFADVGAVAPTIGALSSAAVHRGIGIGVGVYRSNVLMIRADFGVWGGEGHPHYLVPGRGLQF